MADRILGTLLRPLERIYKFPSAQKGAPDTFELDLPIQPVHDLSRMAGIRASVAPINDGFWLFNARHVHAGAGTLSSTPTPFDPSLPVANGFPANRGGGNTETAWWIYNAWVVFSSNSVNYATISITHGSATVGPYVTGASLKSEPIFYSDTDIIFGGTDRWLGPKNTVRFYPVFPIRVMTNPTSTVSEFLFLVSAATGATNVDFNSRNWFGPRGVLPPGQ